MCKVTKNFKISLRSALLSIIAISGLKFSHSQDATPLNGVFEGEHIEYTIDGSNDTLSYIYKLELEQTDNQIIGQSVIYNNEGFYAVVKLRGVLIEDEFYFEEYNTLDEINPEESPWCYNSGHLQIKQNEGEVNLIGFTKSYTKDYGAFCRAGYTQLTKVIDPLKEEVISVEEIEDPAKSVFLEPNPTEAETILHFELLLPTASVLVEVRDLQGELILEPLHREMSAGTYQIPIDLSFQKEGMYIVGLIVERKLYTAELWKESF